MDTRHDRLMGLMLAFAAALLALLVAGFASGAGPAGAAPHPLHAPMLRGTDGGTLGAPLWTGYATGLLIIGIMWVVFQFGFSDRRWIRIAIGVWSAGYAVAFIVLMRAFGAFEAGETDIVAGFTEPAAWLVYGIGLSPWILLLIITVAFTRIYFGPDEQARFEEIIGRSRAAMIDDAGRDPASDDLDHHGAQSGAPAESD